MKRCAICGRSSVALTPFLVGPDPGRSIGLKCSNECGSLLWLSCFERLEIDGVLAASKDERDFTAWQIRRRAAEANERPFNEEPPKSQAEKDLDRVLAEKGLTEIARELE